MDKLGKNQEGPASGESRGGAPDVTSGEIQVMSRRTFLDYLIGASFAFTGLVVLGASLEYLWPNSSTGSAGGSTEVGNAADLAPGQGKVVPYGEAYALIVHTEQGIMALSAVCTHAYCIVRWDEDAQRVVCPCHGAIFDRFGNVVSGPAPRPLSAIPVSVAGGRIYLGAG